MRSKVYRTILIGAFLLACPRLVVSQVRPISEPKPTQSVSKPKLTQSEAKALLKDLASEVEKLKQLHHRSAAIYREMAEASESDSASARKVKRQYTLLAENEEKAARAAERMATRLAALLNSVDEAKH